MRFFGKVWRLLVGVKDALVLLVMLLFFGLLYAALSANPHAGSGDGGALLVKLEGPLVEQPAEASPLALARGTAAKEHRLRDVLNALRTAAEDDKIKAVALDLDLFSGGGQTALTDVGAAIDAVRKAGKPVLAYATGYSDDTYLLAAHASEVWLNPLGAVLIAGPGGTGLYYKGLLDRIGVTAHIYRVGTYKAAVEPFMRRDMSPESREANQAVAAALWEAWQKDVLQARRKAQIILYVSAPAARLRAAGGDTARAALAAGLVDRIGDRTAFGRRLAGLVGKGSGGEPGAFRKVELDAWIAAHPSSRGGGEIGVLTVAGDIVDGEAGPGTAAGETVVKQLHEALAKRNLKALVVRIDSPGGSVLASERIRQAVLEARRQGLPVVASMGSVAASGGYWVASAGERIFAEPSTITGSIGVFGIVPSFEGALAKLGIGADGIRTTPLSGEPNVLRGPSEEADQLLQSGVEGIYGRFLAIVSTARKLPVGRVNGIAQGRIWDGGTARQLGLIDRLGSLEDAVAEAARMAKLDPDDVEVAYLEKEPGWLDSLLRGMAASEQADAPDAFTRIAARPRDLLLRAIGDAEQVLAGPAIQVRCLECPVAARVTGAQEKATIGTWLAALFTG